MRLLLFTVLILFTLHSLSEETFRAEQIIASYTLHFLSFTNNPKKTPTTLCLIGQDQVTNTILNAATEKRAQTAKINIKHQSPEDPLSECTAIYISQESQSQSSQLIARAKDHPILSIGYNHHFLDHGGMIELFELDNRIRFSINIAAAKLANINFDAKLIELAYEIKQ